MHDFTLEAGPMNDFWRKLGGKLRQARNHQGLTQQQVAELVDVPVEVYGRIERGAMLPGLKLLVALSIRLGTTPDQLLGFSSSPRPRTGGDA
jgi:transcriptional regulator with XRE-family HTH domain